MGRHGETTLQKGERFSTSTEFGISGYTLEIMRRVVGVQGGLIHERNRQIPDRVGRPL